MKLEANAFTLKRVLWGDYYYNPKTKKIVGDKSSYEKGEVDVYVVCFVADMVVVVIGFGAEVSMLWVLISFWKISGTSSKAAVDHKNVQIVMLIWH